MKKILIVLGNDENERVLLGKALDQMPKGDYRVIFVENKDKHFSLKSVLEVVHNEIGDDYLNGLVIYSGSNLSMLARNLPCLSVDVALFRQKLAEFAGFDTFCGAQTSSLPGPAMIIEKLFMGGLVKLMQEHKINLD